MQGFALLLALVFALLVLLSAFLVWGLFAGLTFAITKGSNWSSRFSTSSRTALPFAFLSLVAAPLLFAGAFVRSSSSLGTNQLPNGYRLMVVNRIDPGWIYDAADENSARGVNWKDQAISGVVRIQVSGRFILGARTNRGLSGERNRYYPIDSYFLVDTEMRNTSTLNSLEELQAAAAQRGVSLKLQTPYDFYSPLGLPKVSRLARAGSQLCLGIFAVLCTVWVFKLRRLRAATVPS